MDATISDAVDPIAIALTQSRLDYITRHMGWVMTRTARSPIFSIGHDFSCFISDHNGYVIAQADGIPIHSSGGGFAVRRILEAFAGDIHEGDVFFVNDPYLGGGNHLPDVLAAEPVFLDGELIALACNRAHQSDIGGGGAGSYNPEATEIFHEGLRLPPLRVVEAGSIRKDIWSFLLANSRTPDLMDGDMRSMLGSTAIGAARFQALAKDLGPHATKVHMREVLNYADRSMRTAIRDLPDGIYVGEEISNNDCFHSVDVPIRVTITVKGEEITVDFSGSASQIKGFKNSSFANTHSAVYVALATFFGHEIPRNEGTYRCARIIAPLGSVVNPRPPAPTTMCTSFFAHDIIHACWKALGVAAPSMSIAGWGKQTVPITAGPGRDGKPYVMFHFSEMPGAGAVEGRDGFNEIGPMITLGGLTLSNVETYEHLYPVTVHRESFRLDGGGTGEFRGGSGVDYEADVHLPSRTSFRGEGLYTPSGFGAAGGGHGKAGEMTLHADGTSFDPPQFGVREFNAFKIVAASPGGGGWGRPIERDPEAVLRDVRDGITSPETARDVYRVVLSSDGRTVDVDGTNRLREASIDRYDNAAAPGIVAL